MTPDEEAEELRACLQARIFELEEELAMAIEALKLVPEPKLPTGRPKGARGKTDRVVHNRAASRMALDLQQWYLHKTKKKDVPDKQTQAFIKFACGCYKSAKKETVEEHVRRKKHIRVRVFRTPGQP